MNWTKQKLNTEVKFDFLVGDIGFWSLGGVGGRGIFYVDFWNLKKLKKRKFDGPKGPLYVINFAKVDGYGMGEGYASTLPGLIFFPERKGRGLKFA